VSLPGADELFRTTGGRALQSSSPRQDANGEAAGSGSGSPGLRSVPSPASGEGDEEAEHGGREADSGSEAAATARTVTAPVPEQQAQAPVVAQPRRPQPTSVAPAQAQQQTRRKPARARPSGRERHDEKITVYVSAEELMDLEHARLVLRGEHGLAVDRGRIVREAVAVVLADLESRGDASILVRRLRGR
jgi:hypothetical protein